MGMPNAPVGPNPEDEQANSSETSIESFFAASVVFITGVTGFLGKALLEKLLRACPRISTIYVLIRLKKKQTLEQRFQSLLNSSVFERIKLECPQALDKVIPVYGDVSLPNLGLSDEDRLLLTQRVNVVFHSAATVRFDEPLSVAVNLNVKGTQRIIELCNSMMNLVSFVHVSTAYSNADHKEIKETIYSTKIKPEAIIDMCDHLDDDILKILEPKLRGRHPNTYTLTKKFAEDILMKRAGDLPVTIVRPSIICAADQEPVPGWIDSVSGATGFLTGMSMGALRSLIGNGKLVVDIVPVDYVVDTLICAAWREARLTNSIKVYNCVSSTVNPITWGMFAGLARKYALKWPSKHIVWYPGFALTTNRFVHLLWAACLHHLPAYIMDFILKFRGRKPRMQKMIKRYEQNAELVEFFSLNEWKWETENIQGLIRSVKEFSDSSRFNVDIGSIDWNSYVDRYVQGTRKYILKDNPDTLARARTKLCRLYWFQKMAQAFLLFAVMRILLQFCLPFINNPSVQ